MILLVQKNPKHMQNEKKIAIYIYNIIYIISDLNGRSENPAAFWLIACKG